MLKMEENHHLQTWAYDMSRTTASGEGLSAGMPAALLTVRMSGLISTAYTTTGISRRSKRSCKHDRRGCLVRKLHHQASSLQCSIAVYDGASAGRAVNSPTHDWPNQFNPFAENCNRNTGAKYDQSCNRQDHPCIPWQWTPLSTHHLLIKLITHACVLQRMHPCQCQAACGLYEY